MSLLDTIISTLGYADDLGLLNYADEEGLKKASERITTIAIGSRVDADMKVSLPKTKVLHVQEQDPITENIVLIASSTDVGHVIVGMAVCRTGVFALAVVGAL